MNLLNEREKEYQKDEKKLEEFKNKKELKLKTIDEMKILYDIVLKYKYKKYDNSEISNEKNESFNLDAIYDSNNPNNPNKNVDQKNPNKPNSDNNNTKNKK